MPDDSYLSISAIANDEWMQERMRACATQQVALGNAPDDMILSAVQELAGTQVAA